MKITSQNKKRTDVPVENLSASRLVAASRCRQGIPYAAKLAFLRRGIIVHVDTTLVSTQRFSIHKLRERIRKNPSDIIQRIKRWIDE
jgi:hypothetical protein